MPNLTPLGWIGIIILFNSTLIGGASQLGDLSLSVATIKGILAIATLGNGFLGGLVTMFSTQTAQVKQVIAMPGVEHISVNAQASSALSQLAVDPAVNKIAPTTAAMADVTAKATGA